MSGGSFNYLHQADWGDVVWRRDDVDEMHRYLQRLHEEGSPCSGAIAETKEILDALDSLDKLIGTKRLERVWHAAEWHRSCDWGIDQFRDVVAEHYPDPASTRPRPKRTDRQPRLLETSMTEFYWPPFLALGVILNVIWGGIQLEAWYRRRKARQRMRTQYLVKTDPGGQEKVYPLDLLRAGYQLRDNEHVEWR